MIDAEFTNYIISNNDSPQTNKLYLFIENNSATSSGTIKLQLIYKSMKTE
jgi:hypothetical protein